jgi:hypothetical protein
MRRPLFTLFDHEIFPNLSPAFRVVEGISYSDKHREFLNVTLAVRHTIVREDTEYSSPFGRGFYIGTVHPGIPITYQPVVCNNPVTLRDDPDSDRGLRLVLGGGGGRSLLLFGEYILDLDSGDVLTFEIAYTCHDEMRVETNFLLNKHTFDVALICNIISVLRGNQFPIWMHMSHIDQKVKDLPELHLLLVPRYRFPVIEVVAMLLLVGIQARRRFRMF